MKFKKVLCLAAVTAMALSVQGEILAAPSGSYGTINGSLSNGKISEATATDTIPIGKLISNEVSGGKRSIKYGWNRVVGYTYEYQLAGKPDFSDVFRSGTTRTTDSISWSPNTSVNSKDKKYADANIFARVRIVYNSSKKSAWSNIVRFASKSTQEKWGTADTTAPVLKLVTNSEGSSSRTLKFEWKKIDEAKSYYYEIDVNKNFSSPVICGETTNLYGYYKTSGSMAHKNFYARACAITMDDDGNICRGKWSETLTFPAK